MSRRAAATLVLVSALLIVGMTQYASAQKPPRLIVDNRTSYVVELSTQNGKTWNFVTRVAPRSWQQFPNAPNGSRWRAVFGKDVREHTVNYQRNPDGSYQDAVFLVY